MESTTVQLVTAVLPISGAARKWSQQAQTSARELEVGGDSIMLLNSKDMSISAVGFLRSARAKISLSVWRKAWRIVLRKAPAKGFSCKGENLRHTAQQQLL